MEIKTTQKEVYQNAVDHGFYPEGDRNIGEALMLVVSEVAEALEEWRRGHEFTEIYYEFKTGKPEGFPIELADAIIRILDIAEFCGIDLEHAIDVKMQFNKTRPYRHGNLNA